MTDRDKKMRAAMAGVLQYIDEEQTIPVRVEPVPPNNPSNWSFHGRQIIMINRNQMQRHVAKR